MIRAAIVSLMRAAAFRIVVNDPLKGFPKLRVGSDARALSARLERFEFVKDRGNPSPDVINGIGVLLVIAVHVDRRNEPADHLPCDTQTINVQCRLFAHGVSVPVGAAGSAIQNFGVNVYSPSVQLNRPFARSDQSITTR